MKEYTPSRSDSEGTKKRGIYSMLGLQSLPRILRSQLEAKIAHEQAVLRMCTVYSKRVPVVHMERAFTQLHLNPQWVYLKLAEGVSIPELDAALMEVAEPW